MATFTITITAANGDAGAILRRLGKQIELVANGMPDRVTSGASTVLTLDNAPSAGTVSVQVTGGPYQSSLYVI